jgi:hypothetical protein
MPVSQMKCELSISRTKVRGHSIEGRSKFESVQKYEKSEVLNAVAMKTVVSDVTPCYLVHIYHSKC